MDDTQVHQPEMPRVLSSRKSPMAKQAMVVSYTKTWSLEMLALSLSGVGLELKQDNC